MQVTELGMTNEPVRPLQPPNAAFPISMTELGILMLVKLLQPANAKSPMAVTELGTTVFLQPVCNVLVAVLIMALQLPRESYLGWPPATTIDSIPLQPLNAPSSIVMTWYGIVTFFRPLQPLNAPELMELTELGMVVFLQPRAKVFLEVFMTALQWSRES